MNKSLQLLAAFAAAFAASFATSLSAQQYPAKAVRMVVPFAPGGASDFVGRILQPKLGEFLGQQIVIENRAGASGNIGLEAAAKSAPDGYTILLGNVGSVAINHAVLPMTVDPGKDLVAVSKVADVPSIMVAHPSLPAGNARDFVGYAKAKPGALNFASPGSSSLNRLEMERFMKMTGISMVHVPYKGGAGPAVTGLVGGETQVMFVTLVSATNFIKNGRLKGLGISTTQRVEDLSQVPTMTELGFPEMVSSSWQGVFFPAGVQRAMVARMHNDLSKTLASPEVKQRYAAGGALIGTSSTPEEFSAYVIAEMARWGKLARDSGATVD